MAVLKNLIRFSGTCEVFSLCIRKQSPIRPASLTVSECRQYSTASSSVSSSKAKANWNRAVMDAERIVGFPTSYLSLRCLLSDEVSNMATHIQKLIGTNHPLLKIGKRLIYNGRNNMQTRGLIVLLLSKAAGHQSCKLMEQEKPIGITQKQRSLAEITEMIHTAHLIHKGVVNLTGWCSDDVTDLQDMEYGNKIAILVGDYLLANASIALAALKNTYVVEIISNAIKNFMESEFIARQDKQGQPIPVTTNTIFDWEVKNSLAHGSLMANSCLCAMILAGNDEEQQQWAYQFGHNIALAWQVQSDLQPFVDLERHSPGAPLELMSAPMIFHIQNCPDICDYISDFKENIEALDFRKVHSVILGGTGVEEAKNLCLAYAERAYGALQHFKESDARKALENIVDAIQKF